MALIKCPECGKEISDKAEVCIHCGYPISVYLKEAAAKPVLDQPIAPKLKNVIRRCGDGQVVLEKSNISAKDAELYIDSILKDGVYEFSFKHKTGSKFEIIDADTKINYVTNLKNVVRKFENGMYILEESNLSPEEAESCLISLQNYYRNMGEELLRAKNLKAYDKIKDTVCEIVDADAKISYYDPDRPSRPKPREDMTKEELQQAEITRIKNERMSSIAKAVASGLFALICFYALIYGASNGETDGGGILVIAGLFTAIFSIISISELREYNKQLKIVSSDIDEYQKYMQKRFDQLILNFERTAKNTRTKPDLNSGPVCCPKCGSTSISTGARGVNHFWGFIGASKTVNRCAKCGHMWTPNG